MCLKFGKIKYDILRQFLGGWGRNLSDTYKIEKDCFLRIIDILNRKARIALLNEDD
jgi:hypothetical protein